MTPWDCRQIFLLYEQLLAIYEPAQARAWFMTRQERLDDRYPCELIESPYGYQRVCALVKEMRGGSDCDD